MVICEECLGPYKKGISHICTLSSRESNLQMLMQQSVASIKQKVVARELHNLAQEDPACSSSGERLVHLQTGGPNKLTATIGRGRRSRFNSDIEVENKALDALQLSTGLSDKQTKEVAHFFRVYCGRRTIHHHTMHMKNRNKLFAPHFTHSVIQQTMYVNNEEEQEDGGSGQRVKKKTTKVVDKKIAHVKNVSEFVSEVLLHRKLEPEDALIQIGIDHGGQFLKFMCSIKEARPHTTETAPKKRSYDEGYIPKNFALSGVKKMMTLALIKSCERHDNIQTIMELLQLERIQFGLSCDLKMILFLVGKGSASSTHSCPFCSDSKPLWLEQNPKPLTIEQLLNDYFAYQEALAEGKRKGNKCLPDAKKYNNTINKPLIHGPGTQKILGETVLYPEHHVFTGVTSKLVKEAECNLFPTPEEGQAFMDSWFEQPEVNISRTVYHGKASFVGNMAKKILDKIDSLEARLSEALSGSVKEELGKQYVQAFRQFGVVVDSCFGQSVHPLFEDHIKTFVTTYRALGISVTLKLHILERHTAEFIHGFGNGQQGLGFFSEQVINQPFLLLPYYMTKFPGI